MKNRANTMGFTLIEILVSMVIISIAAVFSLTVLKSVSQQQIEVKDNIQYILATKSIKNAFQEYLYSVNLDSLNDGLIKTFYGQYNGPNSCNQFSLYGVGEEKLKRTLCDIAASLSNETTTTTNSTYTMKDVMLTVNKATKNNIQYFTVKTNVHFAKRRSDVVFDRIFVSQVAKGQVTTQTPSSANNSNNGGAFLGMPVLP